MLFIGERLWPNPPQYVDTIAEGIRVQQVGNNAFPIFLEHVEKDIFTVVSCTRSTQSKCYIFYEIINWCFQER